VAEEAPSGAFLTASPPYVPTRPEVMEAMLAVAAIRSDDVVYDLGCGDGRLVIAAAKRFGARGLGVDLDGALVARAQAEAQWQGVADRAIFQAVDLFNLDLRPATVVMLYLSQEINLRLRPKLLAELRPGSRIVSNRFDMADVWRPTRTLDAAGTPVHLWTVPGASG
jgi:trans-aconitate methyltransferase